jgi:ribosome-binding protein aMBF1 (putative translation factor)
MTSHKLYDDSGNIVPKRNGESPQEIAKLAEQLREFRLNNDFTFRQLSGPTRISKSVLQRIEAGDQSLNARTIRKLKRFLEAARAA